MSKSIQDHGDHISGQSNVPISRPAHALSAEDVAHELQTNTTIGLSPEEATQRLTKYGSNELEKGKGVQPLQIFIAQIVNAMTLVLLLALAASFAIQAWVEGGVLGGLILINIVIGFLQDLQAARTIASLESLNSPTARVIRAGESQIANVADLVPGDILDLKTGDVVPADARLLDSVNLEVDEALLTGESLPVRKDPEVTYDEDDVGPGDRLNVVFSSTTITKGRGRAVVFATAMYTEIGAIAAALRVEDGKKSVLKRDENGNASVFAYLVFWCLQVWEFGGRFLGLTVGTPLQRKLSRLFLYIFVFAIVCTLIVLGANKFQGRRDVIIYGVATALGTLPVTLILVLTITMAAGTKVMVQRHVLVRNMRSLEALGGVTAICSDKTGTLTQGKMVMRMAWLPGHGTYQIDTASDPYNPEAGTVRFTDAEPTGMGSEKHEISPVTPSNELEAHSSVQRYLEVASFANLATVRKADAEKSESAREWIATGDPTEIAIRVFVERFGQRSVANHDGWNQLAEFPFDSSVKKMSVLCQETASGNVHVFTKGAVERVIGSCSTMSTYTDASTPITERCKEQILANMEALASQGLRVLALASRSDVRAVSEAEIKAGTIKRDEFEHDLVFRGLVGIYDPPRQESRPSVFKCHQAGISVHMLTGDHPETARAIAKEVGILPARMELLRQDVVKTLVMTAHDFDRLTDDEVDQLPQLPLVVARCAPNTKVRMIDALHRRGQYVAMTGDGVNDSPSLKRADVGIAMGLAGSDVAKSASDIVLTDDNFASILNAVEEGRRIFDNVQKFMLHVLAANTGFVTTLLVGLAYKDSQGISIFQVTPIEILFMLLVAGAFTETGLGFESATPDILDRPPQSLKYGVFTPEFMVDILAYGILMAVCLLGSFAIVLFGMNDGQLGSNCNIKYSESCNAVFRARTTCFSSMMWIFLLFAWELVDSRRSFLDGAFTDTKTWATRLWRNKFLFWSVVIGFVSIVPTIYIPVLNHSVFLHYNVDREWGIIVAMTMLFFAGAELYKWAKRVYLRKNNMMSQKGKGSGEEDLEARVFEQFYNSDMSSETLS
ncbi:calcium-transporting ATPase [Dactylonectria macrodidyma]|uniref:P-type Na(+) transporter n=1 Tax=Dactylonectria macrodidyma TaxID=307937 RepID=A0A9P9ED13_9HYPO|nr:calcium-transporting ATPase [Dactylonectria macrodidyma]